MRTRAWDTKSHNSHDTWEKSPVLVDMAPLPPSPRKKNEEKEKTYSRGV
jgi:hypothetical protein